MITIIRYFSKADESYIGDIKIPTISLHTLQSIFGLSKKNPMYDSYPVTDNELSQLSKYVDLKLDFHKYDYFLELEQSTNNSN